MLVLIQTWFVLMLAGMAVAVPAVVYAEGEHARRAGTELLVLQGDIVKLQNDDIPEKQAQGLRDRVAGSLSGLPLLLRLADQEKGRLPAAVDFDRLRFLLSENGLSALAREVADLISAYPFQGTGIFHAQISAARVRNALQLHKSLCAACHDSPALEMERPPFNLYDQAKNLPEREFAARMLVGVRGDAMIGLENPFTDEEIAALISLYRRAESAPQR